MKTATEIAKDLRAEAVKLTKAADILDPPPKPERKKPGPKSGRRRSSTRGRSNGARGSSPPTSSVGMALSHLTAYDRAGAGTTGEDAA